MAKSGINDHPNRDNRMLDDPESIEEERDDLMAPDNGQGFPFIYLQINHNNNNNNKIYVNLKYFKNQS